MKILDHIPLFYEKFLGLPAVSIPQSTELRNEAVIAESIRYCFLDINHTNDKQKPLSTVRITNWVTRKLRAIIPDITEERDLIRSILSEGPGFNLELLGEVCRVEGGFQPSPTRLVKLNDDIWALISGLPTICFQDMGFQIVSHGLVRHIECSEEWIEESGLNTQSLGSYLNLHAQNQLDISIIQSLFNKHEHNPWNPEAGYLAYMGASQPLNDEGGPFGFKAWGSKALEVDYPGGKVSLWKIQREWSTDYFLVLRKSLLKARLEKKIDEHGVREFWSTFENVTIPLNPSNFKKVCLELDAKSGNARQIVIEETNKETVLKLSFWPPELLLKYFFIIGSEWRGKIGGQLTWVLPCGVTEDIFTLADRLSLKVVVNRTE